MGKWWQQQSVHSGTYKWPRDRTEIWGLPASGNKGKLYGGGNYWAGETGLVRWEGGGGRDFTMKKHSSSIYIRQVCHVIGFWKGNLNLTLEQRVEGVNFSAPFVLLEYLSCPSNFPLHFGVFLEPSKPNGMTLRFFQNSPTRFRITSPEVKAVWMICWWKFDKLGDQWVKGRKSPSEANSTSLHLLLRLPKSPLLILFISPYAQFDTSSTGNWNGGRETSNIKPNIGEYMWNFNEIRIAFALNNIVGHMLVQEDVRVSGKLKMAAWNQK